MNLTLEEKKQEIFKEIAKHNSAFLSQAKWNLRLSRKYTNDPMDYLELTSDVIFSICNKLDDPKQIERYYEMIQQNKFFNFVTQAIYTNATSPTAPFLYAKLVIKKRISLTPNHLDLLEEDERDTSQDPLVDFIYSLLEYPKAEQLFGERWKYFVTIFKEYLEEPKTSYSSLSEKYNIPRPTLALNILTVKNIIRKEIENHYENTVIIKQCS